MRGTNIQHPHEHLPLPCSRLHPKILREFQDVKNKAPKVNAFSICLNPPFRLRRAPAGFAAKIGFSPYRFKKNATIYPARLPAPQGDVSYFTPEKTGKSPGLYAKSTGRNRPFPRRFWPTLPHGSTRGAAPMPVSPCRTRSGSRGSAACLRTDRNARPISHGAPQRE